MSHIKYTKGLIVCPWDNNILLNNHIHKNKSDFIECDVILSQDGYYVPLEYVYNEHGLDNVILKKEQKVKVEVVEALGITLI